MFKKYQIKIKDEREPTLLDSCLTDTFLTKSAGIRCANNLEWLRSYHGYTGYRYLLVNLKTGVVVYDPLIKDYISP